MPSSINPSFRLFTTSDMKRSNYVETNSIADRMARSHAVPIYARFRSVADIWLLRMWHMPLTSSGTLASKRVKGGFSAQREIYGRVGVNHRRVVDG
jgi:hypothetical protein